MRAGFALGGHLHRKRFAIVTAEDAIRFVACQARACRDRDTHEALCLLLPGLMRALSLAPMTEYEAREFRAWFKERLEETSPLNQKKERRVNGA